MKDKDLRTWGATVLAAEQLHAIRGDQDDDRDVEGQVLAAIDATAERLGNTRAVCRSSYVDPRIPAAYEAGTFADAFDDDLEPRNRLTRSERAVRRLIEP